MNKLIFTIFFILISFSVNSNEGLLTIQQQLDRLQREVTDLSKQIYSNNFDSDSDNNNSDLINNFSAIDMRIYDLEKDIKNLNANLEDISFQLEDIIKRINNFDDIFLSLEKKILETKNNSELEISSSNNNNLEKQENSLGSLKITTDINNNTDDVDENTININENNSENKMEINQSPEDQFQVAFDNIRSKNWDEAKILFKKFIEKNPDSQLSGSAHYWLGELYILEKNYRESALILAEGFQKFPDSIKAPDMLFKLSQSLYAVGKVNESCKTLELLIIDFPKNKFIGISKNLLSQYSCLEANE